MFKMSNSDIMSWFNSTHGHANHQIENAPPHLCATQFEFQLHTGYHDRFLMVEINTFRPLSQE